MYVYQLVVHKHIKNVIQCPKHNHQESLSLSLSHLFLSDAW